MKPLLTKTTIAALVAVALFTTAFTTPPGEDDKQIIPVELKFAGTINKQPVFKLVFTNSETCSYSVTIRDMEGMIWYKDKVKGIKLSRAYTMHAEEFGDRSFEIIVTGAKTDKTVIYKVDRSSKLVESLVINKRE